MEVIVLQVNKNWLLKARVGSDCAAAAVALKAWWQPSTTFAAAVVYDFATRAPRIGLTFNVENYGNIRYEAYVKAYPWAIRISLHSFEKAIRAMIQCIQ